jgi:hypothetical protein
MRLKSAEELAVKTRVALAEMGYTKAAETVAVKDDGLDGFDVFITFYQPSEKVPLAVCWQIGFLAGIPNYPCWSCFINGGGSYLSIDFRSTDCSQGKCRYPDGPARPPRELLVPGPGTSLDPLLAARCQ